MTYLALTGRARVTFHGDGFVVEQLDAARLPPGYALVFELPTLDAFPRDQTPLIVFWRLVPAEGWYAKYLRWRHPA